MAEYPGVDYGSGGDSERRRRVYLNYFQWIPILFLCSAGLFYLPRWIWLNYEGGEMEHLTRGMQEDPVDYVDKNQRIELLENVFRSGKDYFLNKKCFGFNFLKMYPVVKYF